MAVSDRDIDKINQSIVDSMNDLGALDQFLRDEPEGRENTMVVRIQDKTRGYSGFCIRGDKAEMVKNVRDPTVQFVVKNKEWYYLFIEDILMNADVRSLMMTAIFSKHPRIFVDPPLEECGAWHIEALLQLFEAWQTAMLGGDE